MFVSSFRSICILFDSLLMRLRTDRNHLHIVYLLMQQEKKKAKFLYFVNKKTRIGDRYK
jgi:hypothetical protein